MSGNYKHANIGDKTLYSHKINNMETKIEIMRYALFFFSMYKTLKTFP